MSSIQLSNELSSYVSPHVSCLLESKHRKTEFDKNTKMLMVVSSSE